MLTLVLKLNRLVLLLPAGLHLTLRVEPGEDAAADLLDAVGARVAVHPRGTRPLPTEEGLSAPPGFLTYIGLKKVDLHKG